MTANTNIPCGDDESTNSTEWVHYEWDSLEQPSVTLIQAIARETGRAPTALPPLHDSIDPDALDALLRTNSDNFAKNLCLSFEYAGVSVHLNEVNGIKMQLLSAGE